LKLKDEIQTYIKVTEGNSWRSLRRVGNILFIKYKILAETVSIPLGKLYCYGYEVL